MTRSTAGGGGYDRQSAAVAGAARKMPNVLSDETYRDGTPHNSPEKKKAYWAFAVAISKCDGNCWNNRLIDAGFRVFQTA
jgi:hypothetical protein